MMISLDLCLCSSDDAKGGRKLVLYSHGVTGRWLNKTCALFFEHRSGVEPAVERRLVPDAAVALMAGFDDDPRRDGVDARTEVINNDRVHPWSKRV